MANAIGAALSQISGTFDRFVDLSHTTSKEAIEMAKKCAIETAVRNGARPETVQIIEVVDTQISYVAVPTRRIKVKAVGDLEMSTGAAGGLGSTEHSPVENKESLSSENSRFGLAGDSQESKLQYQSSDDTKADIAMETSAAGDENLHLKAETHLEHGFPSSGQPVVDEKTGDWVLGKRDVECLCIGAGIMGCGGGGSPYIGRLRLMKLLEEGKEIRIIDPLR